MSIVSVMGRSRFLKVKKTSSIRKGWLWSRRSVGRKGFYIRINGSTGLKLRYTRQNLIMVSLTMR